MTSTSVETYIERMARFREVIAEIGADVAIVDEGGLLGYLTGFDISDARYRACIVPRTGKPIMLVRALDVSLFQSKSWFDESVGYRDWDDPYPILARILEERCSPCNVITLDLDSYCMTAQRFQRLQSALPGKCYVDASDRFARLRWCKSPDEIDVMRSAAKIADATLGEIVKVAHQGADERDLAAVASATFMRLGADHGRTGPLNVGSGWDFLHGETGNRSLAPGDIVHVELVPMVSGYSGRLMRPISIGQPKPETALLGAQLIEIQDAQIAAMVPGAVAKDVDHICRSRMIASGLREDYPNVTGYALGYYSRTTPRVSDLAFSFTPEATWRLEPGMVFHMYVSASGLAFSDSVLVTESGPERLTRSQRKIFVGGDCS